MTNDKALVLGTDADWVKFCNREILTSYKHQNYNILTVFLASLTSLKYLSVHKQKNISCREEAYLEPLSNIYDRAFLPI